MPLAALLERVRADAEAEVARLLDAARADADAMVAAAEAEATRRLEAAGDRFEREARATLARELATLEAGARAAELRAVAMVLDRIEAHATVRARAVTVAEAKHVLPALARRVGAHLPAGSILGAAAEAEALLRPHLAEGIEFAVDPSVGGGIRGHSPDGRLVVDATWPALLEGSLPALRLALARQLGGPP